MSVDTVRKPVIGKDRARAMEPSGLLKDQFRVPRKKRDNRGDSAPACHHRGLSEIPLGSSRAARTGVMVSASNMDDTSMAMTEIAIEPRKSPAGPSNIAMGMKASTVVSVDEISGPRSRATAPVIASIGRSPSRSRLRTSSAITIEPSTSRPSATTSPVSDI